jgi:hypothetical protein
MVLCASAIRCWSRAYQPTTRRNDAQALPSGSDAFQRIDSPMSNKLQLEVTEVARTLFSQSGFRPRGKWYYYCEINQETLGYVHLDKSDGWGRWSHLNIGVWVGVRNHPIEDLYTDIMKDTWAANGVKWDRYDPTIGRPLECIVPEALKPDVQDWRFEEGGDHVPALRDMLCAVNTYGRA